MRAPFRSRREWGFTLMELVVVIFIVGILAAFAVPQYLKSVETNKADDAVALMQMISTVNRMYYLDHNNVYTTGSLTNTCNSAACPAAGGTADPCNLVGCKYLAAQDFNSKSWNFNAADPTSSTACLGLTAGTYTACATRKTTGTNSTNISPYSGWGYTIDVNGSMTTYGSAPTPTQ